MDGSNTSLQYHRGKFYALFAPNDNPGGETYICTADDIEGSLIDHISECQKKAYKECEKISYSKIYQSKPVLDIELSGYKIMATLMEVFVEAAVNPSRFYSKQLLRRVSSQYDIENESLEERIMAVIDYISGMTDIYALDIYQKINGISLPIV